MMQTDSQFPQMAAALNTELMRPLLQDALKLPAAPSAACLIGEKRYKPGKSMLISYRLTDAGKQQTAIGRLCAPGLARDEFNRERLKRPELASGGLACLDDPAMLLWLFPYDRKLTHLPRLVDSERLPALLSAKLDSLGIASAGQLSVTSEVLHYLPERSCMLRYRVGYRSAISSQQHSVLIYGKHYADSAGERVFANMRQLHDQFGFGARALAYDPDLQTLWQSQVPGKPMLWANVLDPDSDIIETVGKCVAQFHACSLETELRYTQMQVEQDLLKTSALAKQAGDIASARIESLILQLFGASQVCVDAPLAAIHHDLKLNNFLNDNGRIGLIDMDCLCLGDPLIDLASLIGNLYLHGLREHTAMPAIDAVANALVRAYRQFSIHPFSMNHLRWQVAAALLHEVTRRSLRQLDFQRLQHLPDYLALSERFIERSLKAERSGDELV